MLMQTQIPHDTTAVSPFGSSGWSAYISCHFLFKYIPHFHFCFVKNFCFGNNGMATVYIKIQSGEKYN